MTWNTGYLYAGGVFRAYSGRQDPHQHAHTKVYFSRAYHVCTCTPVELHSRLIHNRSVFLGRMGAQREKLHELANSKSADKSLSQLFIPQVSPRTLKP